MAKIIAATGISNTNYIINPLGQLYEVGSVNNRFSNLLPKYLYFAAYTDQVAFGSNHAMSLNYNTTGSNTLWAWGTNDYGQLGTNNTTSRSEPTQVGISTDWAQVECGQFYSLAKKADGTLWSWGNNSYGQLGLSDTTHRSSPVQVGAETNWDKISAMVYHVMAIKTNGSLWAWGQNNQGQLGLSDTTDRFSPVQVGTLTDWGQVECGGGYTAAIKTDGTLWTWGYNNTGQLGLSDNTSRYSPVQVGASTDWSKVSVGYNHTIAIKNNGSLWAWGQNTSTGQLGLSDTTNRFSPVQVGTLTDWDQVACGGSHVVAIKTNGSLWAWGDNGGGQLGLGDVNNRFTPTLVSSVFNWTKIFAGANATAATKGPLLLYTWGRNESNVLGYSNVTVRSSAQQIGALSSWTSVPSGSQNTQWPAVLSGDQLYMFGNNTSYRMRYTLHPDYRADSTQASIDFDKNSQQGMVITDPIWVASGVSYSSFGDGFGGYIASNNLWMWGTNLYGQVPNANGPSLFAPGKSYQSVATFHAVKSDGTLWAFGPNTYGVLGLGDTTVRSTPVQVGYLNNWLTVDNGGNHTAAVKTDGTLWTWGYNSFGQLGLSDTTHRSSPVQVGTDTNWSKVSCGENFTLASKTDTSLWAWGNNSYGQLGQNNKTHQSSPVQVFGVYGPITQISCGYAWCNVLGSNTIWSWGYNEQGQLGIRISGSPTYKSTPVQMEGTTNWSAISAGRYGVLGLRTNGTLWAWGSNISGGLGLGTVTSAASPTQIGTQTNWSKISCGVGNSVATDNTGNIWVTGLNNSGQLGFSDLSNRSSFVQLTNPWVNQVLTADNLQSHSLNSGLYRVYYLKDGELMITRNTGQVYAPVQISGSWRTIECGKDHVLMIKTDNTLWAAGSNVMGQLGLNDLTPRSTPTQVGTLATWSRVACGTYHSVATKTDGTLWAWGNNSYGQLGLGDRTNRSSPVQVGQINTYTKVYAMNYTTIAELS